MRTTTLTIAFAACLTPAQASADQFDDHPLVLFFEEWGEKAGKMTQEAQDAEITFDDCVAMADPALGDLLFPDNPEAHQDVIEAICTDLE